MRLRKRQRGQAGGEARERICRDLESLGVSRGFSAPVAERIAGLAGELDDHTYSAILDGVVVAFDAHRSDCEAIEGRSRDLDEIQRLMHGFAGELRKLEEGLRIVSAYVLRMHSKAKGEPGRTLH
jgi:hypothetical protein